MRSVKDLKTDKRFEKLVPYTEEELQAMKRMALEDGEIYHPLFYWKGKDILVYGYPYFKIIKACPKLKHTLREIDFRDWQEAEVWAVEHYISQPEIRLWQKLEASIKCESYWILKEKARKAKGKRNDLRSPSVSKSKSVNADAIIAQKVGCGETYVFYFRKIYFSDETVIISACRKGEMSLKAAYNKLFPSTESKSKPGTDPKKPEKDMSTEITLDSYSIVEKNKNRKTAGKNKISKGNGTLIDPNQIADKIKGKNVPKGSIWIVLYKNKGVMQIVEKNIEKGHDIIKVEIDSYNYRTISDEDNTVIIEANHIDKPVAKILRKDGLNSKKVAG